VTLINDFLLLIVEFVALKQQDLVCHNREVTMDNKFDQIPHYTLKLNNVYWLIEYLLVDVLDLYLFDLDVSFSMFLNHRT